MKQIVPDLVAAGFDASKRYLFDGNTSNYSRGCPAGTFNGAQRTDGATIQKRMASVSGAKGATSASP